MATRRSQCRAFLLASIQCTLCVFAASEYRGQVSFDGVPVPGAVVTACSGDRKIVVITDSMGTYIFPDLTGDSWSIEVDVLGFAKMQGNLSTRTWELTMLPLSEMHAAKAYNASQTSAAAAAPSNPNRPAVAPGGIAGEFANLSPEELNQRAADGLLVNGRVANMRASPPLAKAAGASNRGVLGQPSYYASIGIFPRLSSFNARPFSLTGQGSAKPVYHNFTGSLSFGGPLIPNRKNATFYIGYQRAQTDDASTAAGRMPTADERSGVLSPPMMVVDPLSGLPFAGNVIPQSRISRQAQSLIALFPLPNSGNSGPYNYQAPIVDATHQDGLEVRLNEWLNTRNQLVGSFDFQNTRGSSPNLFSFLDTTRAAGVNSGINWTTRSGRQFLATFGYQFSRLSTRTTPYFAGRLNVAGLAGVNGDDQEAVNWGPPSLKFAGGTSELSDAQYAFIRSQASTISQNSFWNRGRHNITFGGDARRQQSNSYSQQDPRGTFTFTGAATGSDLADFLLGIPDTGSLAFGNADKYLRQTFYSAFVNDDWKVTDVLTVNVGARWEDETPAGELYGRLVNLRIAPGFSAVTRVVGNNFVRPDRRGIMPRIALAWRPIAASSLVVRCGYGIYRNTNVYQPIANQMAQQSPLSETVSAQNSSSNPLTLANGFVSGEAATSNTFAIDPSFRVGYAQAWSFSLQHDLPSAVQMTVMYMGVKGTRLPQESLPNTFPSGAVNPAGYVYMTSNGNSNREAGQIQLRRRLASGFTANAQYTYSGALDNSPLMAGGQLAASSTGGTSIAQDWLDLRSERGPSNFNQRHRLTIQGQYSTGVSERERRLFGGWKGAALKDWTIAWSLSLRSGLPETPVYFASVPGTGITGSLRPETTGASIHEVPPGLFLNPAAFRAPAEGAWGNAGRNSVTGPSQFNLDSSLSRTLRCGRFSVDLRMDVTNVLNHVTFTSWNTTINNVQFGLPVGANAMRLLQPTLRVRF